MVRPGLTSSEEIFLFLVLDNTETGIEVIFLLGERGSPPRITGSVHLYSPPLSTGDVR